MSKALWRPTTESDGIPFDVLCSIIRNLNEWRDEHLPRVGVPSDFESEWDFVSAVSACKPTSILLFTFKFINLNIHLNINLDSYLGPSPWTWT